MCETTATNTFLHMKNKICQQCRQPTYLTNDTVWDQSRLQSRGGTPTFSLPITLGRWKAITCCSIYLISQTKITAEATRCRNQKFLKGKSKIKFLTNACQKELRVKSWSDETDSCKTVHRNSTTEFKADFSIYFSYHLLSFSDEERVGRALRQRRGDSLTHLFSLSHFIKYHNKHVPKD